MYENSNTTVKTIFISAAEHSADRHCASLVRAIKADIDRLNKTSDDSAKVEVRFVGIGGDCMEAAGVELIGNPVGRAAMIYNAFGQVKYFYGLIKTAREFMKRSRPDLTIVCDSPAFNFHIAKAGKKAGSKTLFYVAPQLWAWASWRIGKMRRCCDRLACILPFEKDWFSRRGIDTTFVGNPLFDNLDIDIRDSYKTYNEYDPKSPTVAVFPGSRQAEIKSLYVPMQKVAERVSNRWPNSKFIVCAPDEETLGQLHSARIEGFDAEFTTAGVAASAARADFAMVASGSATLQVAAAGCPMVIMYQSSRLLWNLVGRFLVRTRFLSLVNILAQRELVPEFMPYFTSINPIVEAVYRHLGTKTRLVKLSHDLVSLIEPLAKYNASDKTAQIALELLGLRESE